MFHPLTTAHRILALYGVYPHVALPLPSLLLTQVDMSWTTQKNLISFNKWMSWRHNWLHYHYHLGIPWPFLEYFLGWRIWGDQAIKYGSPSFTEMQPSLTGLSLLSCSWSKSQPQPSWDKENIPNILQSQFLASLSFLEHIMVQLSTPQRFYLNIHKFQF